MARYTEGILNATLNGVDVTSLVATADIVHSATHYIPGTYGKIKFGDVTGALSKNDGLYQAKVPFNIVYSDGLKGNVKEYNLVTGGLKGGNISDSMRAISHDLMICGESFFNAQQIIQHSSIGEAAGDVIKTIHDQYIDPSSPIIADGSKILAHKEHYLVSSKPAIHAVHHIRHTMQGTDQHKSNSFMLFMNQVGQYILTSLEKLLHDALSTDVFVSVSGGDAPNLMNQSKLAASSIAFRMEQDRPSSYWPAASQGGGAPGNRLYDTHSMEYKPSETKSYDTAGTLSSRLTKTYGSGVSKPVLIHDPIHDKELSGDSPPNVDKAQAALQQRAAQGAPYATVNLPSMEPNLDVGKGMKLNIPAPGADSAGQGSSQTAGHFLILHTRHHINMGDSNLKVTQSISGIQTSRTT